MQRGERPAQALARWLIPALALWLVACGAKSMLIDDEPADADADSDVDGDTDTDGDTDSDTDTDGDTDSDTDTDADADPDVDPDVPDDIAEALAEVDGLRAYEVGSWPDGARVFDLYFTQPVDHSNPGGQRFEQYMTLIHRSMDAPMVLLSTGYDQYYGSMEIELTWMLQANQLVLEHRYFGSSVPDPIDWSALTIEQSAADTHAIVEALRWIYAGRWLSTGASKGGMTSIYHRRFFPDDVDATVAYVAPISFGAPDERYVPFLDAAGPEWCRTRVVEVQVEALERRDAMVSRVQALIDASGLSFEYIGGAEGAFESNLVSLPFLFWQYSGVDACSWVPRSDASDDEIFDFIEMMTYFEGNDDAELIRFLPYTYQASTQLGYPDVRTDHIADLLHGSAGGSIEEMLPGVPVTYDGEAMRDIADWVWASGSELMFVYGQWDPWTAGAFDLGEASDSYSFVEPEGTHGASIMGLSWSDREQVYDVLERWSGVVPMAPHRGGPAAPPPAAPPLPPDALLRFRR